jgi:hypothetical protein
MNERTYPGIRKSGRLKSLYCSLEPEEWRELQGYVALGGLSMIQICNKLLREYIGARRAHGDCKP